MELVNLDSETKGYKKRIEETIVLILVQLKDMKNTSNMFWEDMELFS